MIDTFFLILKKSMLAIVMVVFGFAVVYTPLPNSSGGHLNVNEVHAGGVFVDPVNLVENISTAIQTAASFVLETWQRVKEGIGDGIAWMIAKNLISQMISDTVNWINSGFEGSPGFVENLGDALLQAGDVAAGEYISSLGTSGSFVCEPFRLNAQIAVAIKYDDDRLNREAECTLSDVIRNAEDFSNFVSGDFATGGWAGWFDLTARPGNTEYGAVLAAKRQAQFVIENEKGETLDLFKFAEGFKSFQNCDSVPGPDGTEVEQCEVLTPGTTIANSLNKALGASQDTLVEADELNELIGALVGQLATRVIGGASGLLGSNSYTPYDRTTSFEDDLLAGCDLTTGRNILTDGPCTIDDVGAGGATVGAPAVGSGSGASSLGLEFMIESLSTLGTIQSSINTYTYGTDSNTSLRAFSNNTLNEESNRVVARVYLLQAEEILERTSSGIVAVEPLVDQFILLEDEYPDASTNRQNEIANEQQRIIQEFNALNLVSELEYNSLVRNWDALLAENVEPPPRLGRPGLDDDVPPGDIGDPIP